MYLLYLDESGHPTSWTEYNNFVLGGVAIHEGHIMHIARAVDDIQRKHLPDVPHMLELHAQHIAKGKGRWRKMTAIRRKALMDDVYELIAQAHMPGLILFAAVVDVSYSGHRQHAYANAFEQLCSTFDFALIRMFTDRKNPQKGMIILTVQGLRHLIGPGQTGCECGAYHIVGKEVTP